MKYYLGKDGLTPITGTVEELFEQLYDTRLNSRYQSKTQYIYQAIIDCLNSNTVLFANPNTQNFQIEAMLGDSCEGMMDADKMRAFVKDCSGETSFVVLGIYRESFTFVFDLLSVSNASFNNIVRKVFIDNILEDLAG